MMTKNLLVISRTNTWTPFAFSSHSSSTNLSILKQLRFLFIYFFFELRVYIYREEVELIWWYLSWIKLALAKQREPELTRTTKIPEVLTAIGNWITLQKISVPGSLPRTSVLGWMELNINFAKEITTCKYVNTNQIPPK